MFGRFSFWVLVLTFVSVGARAQYDPHFSHYYDMEASFNPAAVGKETKLNVVGAYAMNMVGFEHSPKTMYIGADMPFYALKSYHGAGVNLMNDQLGRFQHQRLNIAYSNKQRLFGGLLGFGLQVGILNESLKGSEIEVNDEGDETIPTSDETGNHVDLCAGLYYSHGNWYAGASVQHLASPAIALGERHELKVDRTYYLTGGYNIKPRNPFLTIPVTDSMTACRTARILRPESSTPTTRNTCISAWVTVLQTP